jgi:hypothetical protein
VLIDCHDATHYAHTHQCDDCRHASTLVVLWHSQEQSDVRCGRCRQGERLHKPKTVTQMWREHPDSVPVATANRLEDKYGRRGR